MDNGLIFPYRRRTAQTNPVMLSVLNPSDRSLRGDALGLAHDPMLVRLAY